MKKLILGGLLALAILTGVENGMAANWVDVVASKDGSWAVDSESLRVNNDIASLWTKVDSKNGTRDLSFIYINSSNRTYALVSGIRYDKEGNVISSYTTPSYALEWIPIAPGTVIDVIYNILFTNPFSIPSTN